MERPHAKSCRLYPLLQLVNHLPDGIRIYLSQDHCTETKGLTPEDGIDGEGILQRIVRSLQVAFHLEYRGAHLSDGGPVFRLDAI